MVGRTGAPIRDGRTRCTDAPPGTSEAAAGRPPYHHGVPPRFAALVPCARPRTGRRRRAARGPASAAPGQASTRPDRALRTAACRVPTRTSRRSSRPRSEVVPRIGSTPARNCTPEGAGDAGRPRRHRAAIRRRELGSRIEQRRDARGLRGARPGRRAGSPSSTRPAREPRGGRNRSRSGASQFPTEARARGSMRSTASRTRASSSGPTATVSGSRWSPASSARSRRRRRTTRSSTRRSQRRWPVDAGTIRAGTARLPTRPAAPGHLWTARGRV